MAASTVDEIIARSLFDLVLRERLLDDPEATLRAEGVEPDAEAIARINALDRGALARAAERLEKRFLAFGKPES